MNSDLWHSLKILKRSSKQTVKNLLIDSSYDSNNSNLSIEISIFDDDYE